MQCCAYMLCKCVCVICKCIGPIWVAGVTRQAFGCVFGKARLTTACMTCLIFKQLIMHIYVQVR